MSGHPVNPAAHLTLRDMLPGTPGGEPVPLLPQLTHDELLALYGAVRKQLGRPYNLLPPIGDLTDAELIWLHNACHSRWRSMHSSDIPHLPGVTT